MQTPWKRKIPPSPLLFMQQPSTFTQRSWHSQFDPNPLLLLAFLFKLPTLRTGLVVPLFSPRSLLVAAVLSDCERSSNLVMAQMEHGLPNWSTWAAWKARVP
jgi:hypothetical protein